MPTELVTDRSLLDRLKAAAGQPLTKRQLDAQRVSFVYGNLPRGNSMSRRQVEAALQRFDGATV